MNRRQSDIAVGVFLGVVLLAGGALSWQASQRRRALDESMGSMMDTSMGAIHGPNPLWYLFGTLLIAGVIGGVYLVGREAISGTDGNRHAERVNPGPAPTGTSTPTETENQGNESSNPEADPRARVLDLLPDDERRILEPVLGSPGITQIELRDRSEFSKSKVSQTVSALEERGLLYRERQGRTYRIYPSDDLQQEQLGP